jgi:hypothetical protein
LSERCVRFVTVIKRALKLTSLRRDLLAAITPERGEAPDDLRRKVAQKRGLEPSSPRWPAFSVSFARSLRILEDKGALEVRREIVLFQKPCMSWVSLTPAGALERSRVILKEDSFLRRETPLTERLESELAHASVAELDALATLVATERARRARG